MSGVHGMARDVVARDWPELTLAELAPVLAAYPQAGAAQRILWHSRRPFAASALVACAGGTFFVKRHDSRVRDLAALGEEHAFIDHLCHAGLGVPPVLRAADGATAVQIADSAYELHVPGNGQDCYRDAHSWTPVGDQADGRAIGRALGRLHRAAQGFGRPARATTLLVAGDALLRASDPVAALDRRLESEPLLSAALAGRPWREDFGSILLPWHRMAQPFASGQAPLWVHGDLHASNALWRDGDVSCVIDFGLSNRASAIVDLATAVERNAIAWLQLDRGHTDVGHADLACALIEGYAQAMPLTQEQLRALPHVLPVVHLDFALSELAYFHGITHSATYAEAAYTDFLLGHAAWFSGDDGVRFLDRLSR